MRNSASIIFQRNVFLALETRHAAGMVQQLINRHAVLQPYLKNILLLEGCEHVISPNVFRFYADGCPGIIFQQSTQGIALNRDLYPTTSVFLYGQTLKPVHLTTSGRFRILVFILYPHAIRPLLGVRADELTETCFDLSRLPTLSGFSLLEQLLRTDSVTEQAETIASCLLRMLQLNYPKADPLLNFALSQIQTSHGTVPLRELQKMLNITERTFERRFEQYIGISPRLFSRICRFQSALEQLKKRQYEKLSDLAFDNGYSDQSHFIRTFREFTGFSPLQLHHHPDPFAENRSWAY